MEPYRLYLIQWHLQDPYPLPKDMNKAGMVQEGMVQAQEGVVGEAMDEEAMEMAMEMAREEVGKAMDEAREMAREKEGEEEEEAME